MLEQLRIRNFQKHTKFDLELDPYITTIVGRTGSGKSSILRALKWVCTNRPGGDRFISWDKEHTTVTLITNGYHVIRRRGKSDNFYSLGDGNSDSVGRYDAIGTSVPESISKILNIGSENFSGQRDPPYWFQKTAGEVAKELNEIVNLDLIDSTLANLASELRKIRSELAVSQERLQQSTINKESLDWAPQADEGLIELEELQTKASEITEKRSRLSDLQKRIQDCLEEKKTATKAISEGKRLLSSGESLFQLIDRRTRLEKLLYEREKLEGEKEEWESKIKQTKQEIQKRFKGSCPICGKTRQLLAS